MLRQAAAKGYTQLFRILLGNQTLVLHGSDVFLESCSHGNAQITALFLPPRQKVNVTFVRHEKMFIDCATAAIIGGHLEVLQKLAPFLPDSFSWKNAIQFAFQHRSTHLIPFFTSQGNTRDLARTGILAAACAGDLDTLKALGIKESNLYMLRVFTKLSSSTLPGARDVDPLSCAARGGHLQVVDFFLNLKKNGANIPLNLFGNAPILAALESGSLPLVKRFLEYPEIDLNQETGRAIIAASKSGNLEVVQHVIGYLRFSWVSVSGPALEMASSVAGSLPVLRYLRLLNPRQSLPSDAFVSAATRGDLEMVKYFDSEGVSFLDEHLTSGYETLDKALTGAVSNCKLEVIDYLFSLALERGIPVNVDKQLRISAQVNCLPGLKTLLSGNFDIDPQANQNAAFLKAVHHKTSEAMELLLSHTSIDPAFPQNQALLIAATHGNLNSFKYLVSISEKYPNIDPSAHRNAAFIIAIRNDHFPIAQYLLSIKSKHPSINPADRSNLAIRVARASELDHLVDYLISLPSALGINKTFADISPLELVGALDEYEEMIGSIY